MSVWRSGRWEENEKEPALFLILKDAPTIGFFPESAST